MKLEIIFCFITDGGEVIEPPRAIVNDGDGLHSMEEHPNGWLLRLDTDEVQP